ncbi:hypothetical protein CBOM_03702 [Ceraceosorus bombacis]|uniref:Uncharacterized protein n=1 Tax=Ceraceosorus bombacis TaxID=401625 RepID=A0A0P1BGS6_9BASI|nr:hypothetical protein CBOM_03702 [Ceraceosorus bombacis]
MSDVRARARASSRARGASQRRSARRSAHRIQVVRLNSQAVAAQCGDVGSRHVPTGPLLCLSLRQINAPSMARASFSATDRD